jgi:hypothetical protein
MKKIEIVVLLKYYFKNMELKIVVFNFLSHTLVMIEEN